MTQRRNPRRHRAAKEGERQSPRFLHSPFRRGFNNQLGAVQADNRQGQRPTSVVPSHLNII